MLEDLIQLVKEQERERKPAEIGVVTSVNPFKIKINGQEYSEEDYEIYVPAVDRIKQEEIIKVITPDTINGTARVNIGDLELEPDNYERRFNKGDLISVTDRGDTFVVHTRLVRMNQRKVLFTPTHRR